jgi:hypothetical protein
VTPLPAPAPARPAFRHVLLAAVRDVPPAALLQMLRSLQPLVPVGRMPIRRVGTQIFRLGGAALRDFCRRAWWGTNAADVLRARLGFRPDEAAAVCDPPDFGPIERAAQAGRGVILAATHVGPMHLGALLVFRRFPDTLFLRRHPWRIPGAPRVLLVEPPSQRRLVLATALAHLRRGGLVHVAPDGRSVERTIDVPLCGGALPLGRGVATLARLSGARAVPVGVGWAGERVRALVGEELALPAAAPLDWERAWLTAYTAYLDRWSRLCPENLPAVGNLYDWIVPARGPMAA